MLPFQHHLMDWDQNRREWDGVLVARRLKLGFGAADAKPRDIPPTGSHCLRLPARRKNHTQPAPWKANSSPILQRRATRVNAGRGWGLDRSTMETDGRGLGGGTPVRATKSLLEDRKVRVKSLSIIDPEFKILS